MPRYAAETTVPIERSCAEIEELLRRHHADEFHSGWSAKSAMIGFRIEQLFIRFVLPFPDRKADKFSHRVIRGHRKKLSDVQANRLYEQDLRSRWRALLLVIKAKLEAVETGISTVEQEFLSFIVMPNQMTVGEWIIDQGLPAIREGQMPRLALAAPPRPPDIMDAEIEESKHG